MASDTQAITLAGYLQNLTPVTIGNIIGGGLVIGGAYYFIGSAKEEA